MFARVFTLTSLAAARYHQFALSHFVQERASSCLTALFVLAFACTSDAGGGDDADATSSDDGPATDPNDPCKPGGEPSLELGEGEVGFAPFVDGAGLELVYGTQGGVHTFMALEALNIDAGEDLVGTMRGYIDGEQIGASFPYLHFRCAPADGDDPGGLQVWGLLLIWDAPPETLHLQPVHIEVEVTDASGLVLTTSKEAVLHDPMQE